VLDARDADEAGLRWDTARRLAYAHESVVAASNALKRLGTHGLPPDTWERAGISPAWQGENEDRILGNPRS
jgi:hypothetical protein